MNKMKYYVVFINKLEGFKVVAITSYEDYEDWQFALEKHNTRLSECGFDWLGFPQVEYHEVQGLSEVN